MTFCENDSRSRKDHSGANHSILRRMAVNLLSRTEGKIPMSGKMKKALLNEDYLSRVLGSP